MTWKTNKRTLTAIGLAIAILSSNAASTQAQMLVFDPNNYSQNVLEATRDLQAINNQITSLQHESTMLINESKNLTSLPYSSLSALQQNVAKTQQLIGQAQHIAYSVNAVDAAFSSTYGATPMSSSDQALVAKAQTRWQNTVGGLQDAMRTQATVLGNVDQERTQMSALVSASQSASGALTATQAGNQLLALQAQQLADLTALIAANGRAQALKEADDTTAAAQGQEQRRRFLQSKNGYQPGSAQMFYGN